MGGSFEAKKTYPQKKPFNNCLKIFHKTKECWKVGLFFEFLSQGHEKHTTMVLYPYMEEVMYLFTREFSWNSGGHMGI